MKMRNYWVSLALLITVVGCAVANDYYTHGSFPSPGSPATSAAMRAELDLITAGFDNLPTLSGNASKAVIVNGSANALSTTAGTLTLAGNFAISGAYATTLTVTGATGVTLPTTGTLATLAGSETLTNKTLNLTSNTLTGTVAQFNTALSDDNFVTLTGTETLTNKTLTSPVLTTPSFSGSATTNLTLAKSADPQLLLNTTSASDRRSMIRFQQSGISKWMISADLTQANAQELYFYDGEAGATRLAIGPTGTVQVYKLLYLSEGQIQFPATQVPSADANTLDDYEEGTWTPSIGGTATYTIQSGKYRKIGRTVFIHCTLQINSLGTGSQTTISGLPFQVESPGYGASLSVLGQVLATNVASISAIANNANTTISMYSRTAASASASTFSVIGSGTLLVIDGQYDAAQ